MDMVPIKAVVGKLSDKKKEAIIRKYHKLLKTQSKFKDIGVKEVAKTDLELKLFEIANKITNDLLSFLGLCDINISSKVFHIVKEEDRWRVNRFLENDFSDCSGIYNMRLQTIIFFEEIRRATYSQKLDLFVHELLHLKSYQSLLIDNNKEICYRCGLMIKGYFRSVDEALTQKTSEFLVSRFIRGHYSSLSYAYEKYVFQEIVNGIFIQNRKIFKNRDDVFYLFLRSYFTGNILPVARLIKRTFGDRALKLLAENNFDFLEDCLLF